ncbi:MAG TPA: hypothetical protein VN863_01910 [Candidatus Dormibacteraeota bacterium]|jgi:hypothetical protein|nr:hypothetical protein [Candidatus Dormibacteraeota bacterium]
MARKPPTPSTRKHSADIAAVRSILDEARKQEIVRLAHSPDRMPSDATMKKLGAVEVQELDGSRIRLDSLWKDRAAAVVWLRHYG